MEPLEVRTLFGGGFNTNDPLNTTGPSVMCCENLGNPFTSSAAPVGPGGSPPPGGEPSPWNDGGFSQPAVASTAPVDYYSGAPDVYADDLESEAFGQQWGVTRVWTGLDDSSQFGNGWTNLDQPYLVINKQDPDPLVEVVESGVAQDVFQEAASTIAGDTTYTETPQLQSTDTLTYVPPTEETVDGETVDTPPEYRLTDAAGDVFTFNGLPRGPGGTAGTLTDASDTLSNYDTYPQEAFQVGDAWYRAGAFVSFQDTRGNTITTQYDPTTGNLTEVDQTDAATGEQERFAYTYTTLSNGLSDPSPNVTLTGPNADATMVSSVVLQERASASDAWSTVSGADYTYYTGVGSDAAWGRLGDLKSVTTYDMVSGTREDTGDDYYRYYKFWGTGESANYAVLGPTNDPASTGGTDTTYPEQSGDIKVFSGLSVVVQGANYDRMVSAYGSLAAADGSTVSIDDLKPYASNTFTYNRVQYDTLQEENHDTGYQVVSETSQGEGCSCLGNDGVGQFTYVYSTPTYRTPTYILDGDPIDYNEWVEKTIETLPSTTPGATTSDDEDIVYTNEVGQVLLDVVVADGVAEPTYYHYDSSDRLDMIAMPSALAAYNVDDPSLYEDNPDLVGYDASTQTYANISANAGLIEWNDYATITTATATTAGNVAGYLVDDGVQQGYDGTPIVEAAQTYIALQDEATGAVIYPIATSTAYRNADGTGAETTSYQYTCATVDGEPTDDVTELTTTAPVVSVAQDGTGTADVTQEFFDSYGRVVWSVDPNGYIDYTQYDPATGAIVKQVTDVDPSTISDPSVAGPTRSPTLPAALNLTTTYEVDGLGRTTEETDPNGNVTYTVYVDNVNPSNADDTEPTSSAVFVFPGATLDVDGSGDGTLTTTGPIEMERTGVTYTNPGDGLTYTYAEAMTFSGTVTVTGGQIVLPGFTQGDGATSGEDNVLDLVGDGTTAAPQYTIQSLSRELTNTGGQEVESDAYATVTNALYLATAIGSAYSGTQVTTANPTGDYDATTYFYDGQGNQTKVVSPDGTITRTVYDGQGRVVSKWVGTAEPTTGWWSPTNPGNLVDVEDFYYDDGGTGDGDLTETVTHPGGGQPDRATLTYYDWRDRPVAVKTGVPVNADLTEDLSAEVAAAAHVPITYTTYDNLGEAVEQQSFDGDGVAVTTTDGVPQPPAADLLVSETTTSYDDQGRVYQSQVFDVDPATGDVGAAQTTSTYYDGDGNVVERVAASGLATWTAYDGADRPTDTYEGAAAPTPAGGTLDDGGFEQGGQTLVAPVTALADGSFEEEPIGDYVYDPTGSAWSFSGNSGIEQDGSLFGAANAPDGTQAVFFQSSGANGGGGDGTISQAVTLAAGTYVLTFDAAARSGFATQPIEVEVDGSSVGLITPASDGFSEYSVQFTIGSAGSHTIAFVASGASGDASGANDGTDDDSFLDYVRLSVLQNGYVYDPTGSAWSFSGNSGLSVDGALSGAAAAPEGSQAAFLESYDGVTGATDGSISQTVTLAAGTYTLQLDAAERDGYGDQPFAVSVDGTVVGTVTPTSDQFTNYSFLVTVASSGSHVLAFAATGAAGDQSAHGGTTTADDFALVDDVRLTVDHSWRESVVLTQTQTTYDADGNAIETVALDRVPTDSSTAVGTLSYAPIVVVVGGGGGPDLARGPAPAVVVPGHTGGFQLGRPTITDMYYDAANRLVATVDVGTNDDFSWSRPSTVPDRTGSPLVTSYTYDAAGNVATSTDPDGLVTATTYDALGRTLTTVADYTDGTPTDSSNQTTDYTYDGDGNVTSMTAVMPAGEASQTTGYLYGVSPATGSVIYDDDLLAQTEYPDPTTGAASSSQAETYAYDALGEETTYTDRNGTTHAYTYDSLGRLTADTVTAFGTGVDTTVAAIGYTYDSQGLLATSTSYAADGTVVNQTADTYDGFGNLISEAQSVSGAVTGSTPTVQYTYDPTHGDRPTSMVYPNGRVVTYTYAAGIDDDVSRITSIGDSSGTIQSYTYLGLDTPVTFTDGNGTKLTYVSTDGAGDNIVGLDEFGRVDDQDWVNSSGTTVDEEQYTYDDDSNVLSRDDTVLPGQSELYTYDGLNRLTTFERGTLNDTDTAISGTAGTTESWSLDALGNWQSNTVDGSTTTRTNSAQNQVATVTVPGTDGTTVALTYDANGNTTTDQTGQKYVYDAWNRLVAVKNESGTTIAVYTYDAQGRRVTETESGTTTALYYSNQWQVLEERVGGTPTAQYVWSPFDVDRLVERDDHTPGESGTALDRRLYAEVDADDNVTSLTDSTGTVVERYVYDPYGAVTVENPDGTVRGDGTAASSSYGWVYLHQGLRLDVATGTYDDRHRVYIVSLGRFAQEDPAGFVDGLNRYQEEQGEPIARTDPSGDTVWYPLPGVGPGPMPVGNPVPPGNYVAPVQVPPTTGPVLPTAPGHVEISLGGELTVGTGLSLSIILAIDNDGNAALLLSPSGRIGLNVGAGPQCSYVPSSISDIINSQGTPSTSMDISGGIGIISGTIDFDPTDPYSFGGAGGGAPSYGPKDISVGVSVGVLDPNPIVLWHNCPTTEPTPPPPPSDPPTTNDNPADDGPTAF